MKKNVLVVVGMLLFIFLTGCSFDEKVEEIGSRDTLTVLSFSSLDPTFIYRMDFVHPERIEQVRDLFTLVEWEEDPEEERSHPNYKIEQYTIWLRDDSPFIEAVDLTTGKYAELTAEESTIVLGVITDAFY